MTGRGKRIDRLCSFLSPAKTFADVGCDHGYASEYMLKNGLCEKAVLSDISQGSLQKAKDLLKEYLENGKAVAVCGDGFFGVPSDTEEVMIAGMGGFEIVGILSDRKYGFMPKRFLFQPMKDGALLREYVLKNGGYIERDLTFFADGKFYDVIVGRRLKKEEVPQTYSETELAFGKENVRCRPSDFLKLLDKKIAETEEYLTRGVSEKSKAELMEKLNKLKGVRKGETR